MQILNTVRMSIGNSWRIDEDGNLLVRARVLKEGVYPYYKSEVPELEVEGEKIDVYIPASEFTPEALETIKGKDVVVDDHIWRTVDNSLTDGYSKGSVAGEAEKDDSGIICDLLIKDKQTIEDIQNKVLVEISAGYRADFEKSDGEYEGKPYTYVQKNIVFNHVLLCKKGEGRCGADVKVINKKQGEDKMSHTIRYKIGNKDKEMEFSSKEDADKAEAMASDREEAKQVDVDNAVEELKTLKDQVKTLNEQIEEKSTSIEEYKAKLEEALSPEAQEELAEDILAQREAEDDVVEEEVEEKEKEEVKNSLKAMNRLQRACHLATIVMNKKGIDISKWAEDAKVASFMTIAAEAKVKVANKKANPAKANVAGAKILNTKAGNINDAKARMFSCLKKKGE